MGAGRAARGEYGLPRLRAIARAQVRGGVAADPDLCPVRSDLGARGAVCSRSASSMPAVVLIPYLLLAMALTSGGEVFHYPLNGSVPVALAPEELRGRYLALFSLVWSVAGHLLADPGLGLAVDQRRAALGRGWRSRLR